jgi:hypothetical protein
MLSGTDSAKINPYKAEKKAKKAIGEIKAKLI